MTPQFDAVIVPGGGVRSGGKLPPWVENRFDRALEIAAGGYIIALSAGTVHRPRRWMKPGDPSSKPPPAPLTCFAPATRRTGC